MAIPIRITWKHSDTRQCQIRVRFESRVDRSQPLFYIVLTVKLARLVQSEDKTRLTYNCAHLRSTKESLTI